MSDFKSNKDISQKRLNKVHEIEILKKCRNEIAVDKQEYIKSGQVVLGMTPYEAYLAGGAFAFKVVADSEVWGLNPDPYDVMWKQSTHPDRSQIWMTFKNTTQYATEGVQTFRVFFENGLLTQIEKLLEKS